MELDGEDQLHGAEIDRRWDIDVDPGDFYGGWDCAEFQEQRSLRGPGMDPLPFLTWAPGRVASYGGRRGGTGRAANRRRVGCGDAGRCSRPSYLPWARLLSAACFLER